MFRFREPADHDDGEVVVEGTELADKFGPVHVRHDVVSDYGPDLLLAGLTAEQCQGAASVRGDMAFHAALAQDKFADRELNRVVVEQEDLFHRNRR